MEKNSLHYARIFVTYVQNKKMINIFHTGHAGFVFKYDNIILVTDHWSSKFKPFENSWQKLENDNFSKNLQDHLLNPDYIWCSHEHGDHYDPGYIRSISNKNAKILMPNFKDESFENLMRKDGIKLDMIFLNDLDSFQLSKKFKVKIIFEEPIYTNHSSLFMNFNDQLKCFHNADTTPIDDFYKKAEESKMTNVDIFIGQYTNPTPYPWSIDMENFNKEQEAIDMHKNCLNLFVEMCDKFNAKNCFPCAGPAIVDRHNVDKYCEANKLIFNKEKNLLYLRDKMKSKNIHDIRSGKEFIYEI